MCPFQWQALSLGPERLKHTHAHMSSLFKPAGQWNQSFQLHQTHGLHYKPEGIEALFTEASFYGKQGSIVREPGNPSISSILQPHTLLSRIFQFRHHLCGYIILIQPKSSYFFQVICQHNVLCIIYFSFPLEKEKINC